MNLTSLLPAQYAKFITSLAGLLIVYLQMYGASWHLVPAVTAIGAALGVLGVPNAPKPVRPAPFAVTWTSGQSPNATTHSHAPQAPPL